MDTKWTKTWDQLWERIEGERRKSRREKRTEKESIQVYTLGDEQLDQLEKAVRKRNIPLSQAIQEAIDLYCQHQEMDTLPKIREERKEQNPLLRLEGLCVRGGDLG
ncbi:hypothetical protein [Ammoniphilus sp. YIM 78166]|uniref:hypothetical protein n=1 Tax=Ammoniphilus sp. YIM 78166 TaxID=1644106 RepID=UPI00107039C8|nr:hypothetical protein [Ammoniphilus sp. YIM 78166]